MVIKYTQGKCAQILILALCLTVDAILNSVLFVHILTDPQKSHNEASSANTALFHNLTMLVIAHSKRLTRLVYTVGLHCC